MPSATKRKAKATALPPTPSSEPSRAWDHLTPPLSPWVLDAISSMGFEKMTPVQASTIPLFMGNKDVVVEAVTGSGKTLAFLIPMVERILRAPDQEKKGSVAAVIVSPTRELASQIHSVLLSLVEFHGPSSSSQGAEDAHSGPHIKPLLLLGGKTSPAQDLKNFLEQSPNVLIGTPGRLNDLLSSSHVHCRTDSFEALVLDEADRLLDLGFKETLTKIIARLPKQRRTGLFSATVSDAMVGSLVRAGLRNPVKIVVKVRGDTANEEKRTPASLQMTYLLATPAERLVYLPRILQQAAPQKCIIYLSNCASVDYYAPLLHRILDDKTGRHSIVPLHGKQSPSARNRFFRKFVDSVTPCILLTTDLAARGLDVPAVDLVIQLDAPTDPKAFLHRCGRAGRAGRRGLAVLFLSPGREEDYLSFLEVRKTPVSLLSLSDSAPPTREDVDAVVSRMRTAVLQDRALHDKATKAFVSHVRAHSKHQTASIFRVADLGWEDLARTFAMVKMPRMPELKGLDVQLGVEVDMDTYRYKDKVREAQRLKELEEEGPKGKRSTKEEVEAKKRKNAAWSEKTEGKETKEARRAKKRKRRDAERDAKMKPEERAKQEEWRELVEAVKRQQKEKETAEDEEEFKGLD